MDKKYLKRMIVSNPFFDEKKGKIRFKYYGDFDGLNHLYDDCKNFLYYVGNSGLDGAPIFEYNYDRLSVDNLVNFNELNVLLRRLKIIKYKGEEICEKDQSLITFLKFFMSAVEGNLIKGASNNEILLFQEEE